MPAKSLELKHTIKLIRELDAEIEEIEFHIEIVMDEINSPILTIPGISYRMGAMIVTAQPPPLYQSTVNREIICLGKNTPINSNGAFRSFLEKEKQVVT